MKAYCLSRINDSRQFQSCVLTKNPFAMEPKTILTFKKTFIKIAAVAGILGCMIDTIATFLYGARIEGYNQFRIPMSQLGIASSPVARQISISWILMGTLLIIFGLGLRFAFEKNKRSAIIICWLLILYGFGEGLISGIFPADKAGVVHHSWVGYIHNLIGGVGVIAIMLFPLFMIKLLPDIKWITTIVLIIGSIGVIMFAIGRLYASPTNFLAIYKGSWQKLYVFVYYLYIIIIAVNMIAHKVPFDYQEKVRI
jgi:hypothetical protein